MMALVQVSGLYAQAGGTIHGRITDGANSLRGELLVVRSGGTLGVQTIATDDQGTFNIELPAGRTLLVARAAGHVSEEREIIAHPGAGNPAVQFTLAVAGSVSGRVVDETGAPATGARVWIEYPGTTRTWRTAEESGGEPGDPTGSFTLPIVARGRPFILYVEIEGRLLSISRPFVLLGAKMGGIALTAGRKGAMVRGRVVDSAGYPIAGASVRMRVSPADGEFPPEQRGSIAFARTLNKRSISAMDGSYSFAGVPSGRVVLTADDGRRRSAREASVSGPESEVLLVLR